MQPKTRRAVLVLVATATAVGCTLDFDKYDPAATTADGAAQDSSAPDVWSRGDGGQDAARDQSVGGNDSAVPPGMDGGSNTDAGGGTGCGASGQTCLSQASQCGAQCQSTLQSCLSQCGGNFCKQQCQTTDQSCVQKCGRTCSTCWTQAGCTGTNDCADAAATD
jgi:hypothetical protein